MINYRPATLDDITDTAAMVMSDEFWKHVENYNMTINLPDAMAYFTYMINKDSGMVYVATSNDKVVGFIIGEVLKNWWNDDLYTTDYALYVHSKYRNLNIGYKLIKYFVEESKLKGAKEFKTIMVDNEFNTSSMDKLLRRQGFTKNAVLYKKDL